MRSERRLIGAPKKTARGVATLLRAVPSWDLQSPIVTNSMLITFRSDKEIVKAMRGASPPSEEVRAKIRKEKPQTCDDACKNPVLHGNGWRCRSVLKSWNNWNVIWYWRLECQSCGRSYCLMPEQVIPDLLYGAEVVANVIAGRLAGVLAKAFAPHPRTQKRWLDRIRDAWPVALSIGAIQGALSEGCGTASRCRDAIFRCASCHVGLFFPSHAERTQSGGLPRWKYPAIATHQTCP